MYIVGLPLACLLMFVVFKLGVAGVWIALVTALTLMTFLLLGYGFLRIRWEQLAIETQARVRAASQHVEKENTEQEMSDTVAVLQVSEVEVQQQQEEETNVQ